MKKNILLTGATGFVGEELLRKINNNVFHVFLYKRNANIVDLPKIDYIVHLAGKAHDKGAVWQDFQVNNIELTQQLVDFAKKNNKDLKFIYFSSAKVYGEYSVQRFKEQDLLSPQGDYGKSKKIAEEIVINSGLAYIIFRPSLIFSPQAKGNLETLRKISRAGVPMPSNIKNKRSLANLDFVVRQTISALEEKLEWHQVYNLCDQTLSTTEIFKINGIKFLLPYPSFLFLFLPKVIKQKIIMDFELDNTKILHHYKD